MEYEANNQWWNVVATLETFRYIVRTNRPVAADSFSTAEFIGYSFRSAFLADLVQAFVFAFTYHPSEFKIFDNKPYPTFTQKLKSQLKWPNIIPFKTPHKKTNQTRPLKDPELRVLETLIVLEYCLRRYECTIFPYIEIPSYYRDPINLYQYRTDSIKHRIETLNRLKSSKSLFVRIQQETGVYTPSSEMGLLCDLTMVEMEHEEERKIIYLVNESLVARTNAILLKEQIQEDLFGGNQELQSIFEAAVRTQEQSKKSKSLAPYIRPIKLEPEDDHSTRPVERKTKPEKGRSRKRKHHCPLETIFE